LRKDEFFVCHLGLKDATRSHYKDRANQKTFSFRCRVEKHSAVKNLTGNFRAEE